MFPLRLRQALITYPVPHTLSTHFFPRGLCHGQQKEV